jgi:transaldolase
MQLIQDIRTVYDNYPALETKILVASIRHPTHVLQSAMIGADVCTVPPDTLRKLAQHPLTDKGLAAFLADWQSTGQDI